MEAVASLTASVCNFCLRTSACGSLSLFHTRRAADDDDDDDGEAFLLCVSAAATRQRYGGFASKMGQAPPTEQKTHTHSKMANNDVSKGKLT